MAPSARCSRNRRKRCKAWSKPARRSPPIWGSEIFRHPEVAAISAFTRVLDALWWPSKGDGPRCLGRHPSRLAALAPQDDGPLSMNIHEYQAKAVLREYG